MGPLPEPGAAQSLEPTLTSLVNALAERPVADQALLVLDDYHLIDSEPVHASLRFFLPETAALGAA